MVLQNKPMQGDLGLNTININNEDITNKKDNSWKHHREKINKELNETVETYRGYKNDQFPKVN